MDVATARDMTLVGLTNVMELVMEADGQNQ